MTNEDVAVRMLPWTSQPPSGDGVAPTLDIIGLVTRKLIFSKRPQPITLGS